MKRYTVVFFCALITTSLYAPVFKDVKEKLFGNNKTYNFTVIPVGAAKILGNPVPILQRYGLDNKQISFALSAIVQGGNYAYQLWYGNPQAIPTDSQQHYLESIVYIVWYLYSMALYKEQPFISGTFVIQDPEYRLYNFMIEYARRQNKKVTGTSTDKPLMISYNAYSYPRKSTHFSEYKDKNFRQYGIDMRFKKGKKAYQIVPPIKKTHLLFGKVDDGRSLMFIKPEEHGLYYLDGFAGHAVGLIESQIRKKLPKMKSLLPAKLYNSLTDLVGAGDDPNARRERVMAPLVELIIKHMEQAGWSYPKQQQVVEKLVRFGIWSILNSIKPLATLYAQIEAEYDHLSLRKGSEVIIAQPERAASLYYYLYMQNSPNVQQAYNTFNTALQIPLIKKKIKKAEVQGDQKRVAQLQQELKRKKTTLSGLNTKQIARYSPKIYRYLIALKQD